ncbi:MAG: hypothetical protein ABTQ32_40480 [Myxococcaceae bacterium]
MSLTRMMVPSLALLSCGSAVPEPAIENEPVRVISGQARPAMRELTLRVGSCAQREQFSVMVEDPDVTDTLRSLWFIDPNERYSGGTPGNPAGSGTSATRELRATAQFMIGLEALTDGRKHRIEVVVTDGEFLEDAITDPLTMELKPYLKVTRPSIPLRDGGTQLVEAYRDDYVWLVEVSSCP